MRRRRGSRRILYTAAPPRVPEIRRMGNTPKRHLDKSGPLPSFADIVIAVCPDCRGPAVSKNVSPYSIPFRPVSGRVQCLRCTFARKGAEGTWFGPSTDVGKERCPNCGFKWLASTRHRRQRSDRQKPTIDTECPACHTRVGLPVRWKKEPFKGDAIDPVFGLPLWLQTPCCGHTLWAYNRKHLNELQLYVTAALRERIPNGRWTMFTRLPQWIKSGKNREAVLRSLRRLELKLKKLRHDEAPRGTS